MDEFIAITKALSDPNRVRALMALRKGELCVCQIIALLGLAPSTVSKHMSVLRQAKLVENRKEERWMHYRLPDSGANARHVRNALDWLSRSLADDAGILDDDKRLSKIVGQNPEILCRKLLRK